MTLDARHWTQEFAAKIHAQSALHAEMQALVKGLELAYTHNLFPIIMKADTQVLATYIKKGTATMTHTNILYDCRFLMTTMGGTPINHIYREMNSVTHKLADIAANLDDDMIGKSLFWDTPPISVNPMLDKDILEIASFRSISLMLSAI
ncbi:uncharacterized protein LOC132048770 [Lycium ferocissimum]|uniref:uncharacterized protein LOC132048770 n=1 Tax=Lycium ferocissimum TaxID=112874 RepID=UPI002816605A|nr:uncharacterized protein LOC132048770 [Lycium ferocissimum]